jgi:hypothetical protein
MIVLEPALDGVEMIGQGRAPACVVGEGMATKVVAPNEVGSVAIFRRRDVFLWIVVIFFANHLVAVLKEAAAPSLDAVVSELAAVGIFQYAAWYAVFRLLFASNPTAPARMPDYGVAVLLCLVVMLPTGRAVWVAGSGAALYFCLRHAGDLQLRAAGMVLGALSIQAFWGHFFFNFVALDLLRIETAAVGTLLQMTQTGIEWQDNVITAADGHGIIIYSNCSSFHNLALAMLCWVTVTKLRRPRFRPADFIVAAVAAATMILLNFARLYLMALNLDQYNFWHHELGAELFSITASLAILSISLYGSSRS